VEFEENSKRSIGKRSKELRKTVVVPVLTNATKMSLIFAGKMDAAKICSGALETAPTGALRTASRFSMAQICRLVLHDISKKIFLISEWACDASTVHSEYKQRALKDVSDSDIVITFVVYLQLYLTKLAKTILFFGRMLGIFRGASVVPPGYST